MATVVVEVEYGNDGGEGGFGVREYWRRGGVVWGRGCGVGVAEGVFAAWVRRRRFSWRRCWIWAAFSRASFAIWMRRLVYDFALVWKVRRREISLVVWACVFLCGVMLWVWRVPLIARILSSCVLRVAMVWLLCVDEVWVVF